MNNSSGGTLISIPSVLCGDDGLSRHIAASYGPCARTEQVKECRHFESCLTEYPIITEESVTSFLFFSISIIKNNTSPLSGESHMREIEFGKKISLRSGTYFSSSHQIQPEKRSSAFICWSLCSF